MNKVVLIFSACLTTLSSAIFAATTPQPYVPDTPASTVVKKVAPKKQKTTSGQIQSLTATRLQNNGQVPAHAKPANKITPVKQTAKAAVKQVKPKAVAKPQAVALNTTSRLNKNKITKKPPTNENSKVAKIAPQPTTKPVIAKRVKPTVDFIPGGPSLASGAALVMNASTGRMVFGKNPARRTPIASITKLMTAMVVLDAGLQMDTPITIADSDVDRVKKSSSRLEVGTTLSRHDTMWLALMSSENRAAHSLARTYPGGVNAFVNAMNKKARSLGMLNTRFYDPTGLNKNNTSTAADLALMAQAAYRYPLIRQFTTSTEHDIVSASGRPLHYQNSNALVREGVWEIELSKTGYIKEAGRCLVMVADVHNKPMVMVFLDANAPSGRINDARNLKNWLETKAASGELG